jgi:hypothetical protein
MHIRSKAIEPRLEGSTMKKASNVALAIGAGYLLGRKRKGRLALVLAGAAATGKLGGVATQAIKRGGSLVGSSEAVGDLSPELGKVMGTVKGDLADAGKAAVRAAAAGRINRLTDSLHERAEGIRNPRDEEEDEAEAEAEEQEPEESDDDSRKGRRTGRDAADVGSGSGRRDTARPRRREPSARDTDRPSRRREPERGDHGDGGPSRRAAKRPAADGGSRSSSARKRGK